jgi:hypothetical protein
MDHTQLGEASLTPAVNPLWVPPSRPFYVYIRGENLASTRPVDLVDVQNPFRSEAERFNPWASHLGEQDIRLFAMQLNDKDAITGTLLTFERRKCPQYSALSYVCGQGTCDQEVYVNGGRLRVKPNLMAALKQFKSCMTYVLQDDGNPSKPLEDRICWVWVDAMSINQADATEKAEQIGGMHHIYREASKVDVCLGYFGSDLGCVALILRWVEGVRHPAESGRRRWTQFELVEQLRNFGVSPSNLRAIFDNMQIDLESHLERESLKKSIGFKNCNRAPTRFSKDEVLGFEESSVAPRSMQRNPTFFEKMFDILEHEWFSRLWTYQEYHLAVMCEGGATLEYLLGDHAIYWDTLTNLWLAMISPVDPLGTYLCISKKRIERNFDRVAVEYPGAGTGLQNQKGGASLWTLLEISCQRKAAVVGDHVFAIVGLMGPEMRSHILIDYSRSDASIFTNAFELAINHEGGDLRLPLCWDRLALIPSITPELPSWCPDLVNESNVDVNIAQSWEKLSDRTQKIYKRFANVRVSPSEKCLHLSVMKADAVAQVVGMPCPSISPDLDASRSRLDWAIVFAGLLGTWFLRMHSTFSSTDGQEDTPIFEPGSDALLWQYLSLSHVFSPEMVMDHCFPGCSNVIHECVFRRLLTDPGWCFKKLLSYIRLVRCLRGNVFHPQHQWLGTHQDEGCSICNPSVGPKLLAVADRCGVHIDRISINLGSSECRPLQPSGEERLLTALLYMGGLLEDKLHGMYIFKTAAGRYGHSPRCPSVGDHVCVVPGGELLHIISAENSRYVGAASVVGLMGDNILEQDLFPDPEGRFEEVVLH